MTNSKITPEQVRRLGDLAKINISAQEEPRLMTELSSILDYFEAVDAVGEVAIDEEPGHLEAHLRPDEVHPSDPEGVLKGVPQMKGRLVRAPRVF